MGLPADLPLSQKIRLLIEKYSNPSRAPTCCPCVTPVPPAPTPCCPCAALASAPPPRCPCLDAKSLADGRSRKLVDISITASTTPAGRRAHSDSEKSYPVSAMSTTRERSLSSSTSARALSCPPCPLKYCFSLPSSPSPPDSPTYLLAASPASAARSPSPFFSSPSDPPSASVGDDAGARCCYCNTPGLLMYLERQKRKEQERRAKEREASAARPSIASRAKSRAAGRQSRSPCACCYCQSRAAAPAGAQGRRSRQSEAAQRRSSRAADQAAARKEEWWPAMSPCIVLRAPSPELPRADAPNSSSRAMTKKHSMLEFYDNVIRPHCTDPAGCGCSGSCSCGGAHDPRWRDALYPRPSQLRALPPAPARDWAEERLAADVLLRARAKQRTRAVGSAAAAGDCDVWPRRPFAPRWCLRDRPPALVDALPAGRGWCRTNRKTAYFDSLAKAQNGRPRQRSASRSDRSTPAAP